MDRIALLVSTNEHKARELERALPGWTVGQLSSDVPEEAETYYENALAKVRHGHASAPGEWVLGEDSGVEVDALGGAPGIRSARWAPEGTHVERLLHELEGVSYRGARYVCELVLISPEGEEFRGTGELRGWIAHEPRGTGGFGYDPVFVPELEMKSVAELGDDWKAQHSHRARAAQALLVLLPK